MTLRCLLVLALLCGCSSPSGYGASWLEYAPKYGEVEAKPSGVKALLGEKHYASP